MPKQMHIFMLKMNLVTILILKGAYMPLKKILLTHDKICLSLKSLQLYQHTVYSDSAIR